MSKKKKSLMNLYQFFLRFHNMRIRLRRVLFTNLGVSKYLHKMQYIGMRLVKIILLMNELKLLIFQMVLTGYFGIRLFSQLIKIDGIMKLIVLLVNLVVVKVLRLLWVGNMNSLMYHLKN